MDIKYLSLNTLISLWTFCYWWAFAVAYSSHYHENFLGSTNTHKINCLKGFLVMKFEQACMHEYIKENNPRQIIQNCSPWPTKTNEGILNTTHDRLLLYWLWLPSALSGISEIFARCQTGSISNEKVKLSTKDSAQSSCH